MKKNHQRNCFTSLMLAGLLSFSGLLTGCGKNPGDIQIDVSTAAATEISEEPASAPSTEESTIASDLLGRDLETLSAKEFSILLGNGTNLGNTMEAYGHKEGTDKDISFYETLWSQPVTTQEMLTAMKESGFDTVRIPVAWTNTMNFEDGDYTIREDHLARVKEIVDYAYNANLNVIINDHWDGGWWGMFGSADKEKRESAAKLYTEMWTQVANYFKDYDYRLIFEGGNEEIGDRLNDIDADFNPNGATLSKDECYALANELNQTFVDLIRSTGGNNANRFLLIPGYGTDLTQTLDDRWHMPSDTAKDKLFLSVHYYTPWSYCGSTGSSTWGTIRNYDEMNSLMKSLQKYSDYGIIIGESGVLPTSSNELKPNALLWFQNFYANCDMYGYVPCLWDTGNFLNKNTGAFIDEELLRFFQENRYENQKNMTREELTARAQSIMDTLYAAAPETFQTSDLLSGDGKAIAWIMWDSQDWNIVYSVGDTYDPDSQTAGIKATDVEITGEGTYTVGLDFTGTDAKKSISTAFSAIGISNGETLFPGYTITITEVLINGEPYKLHGRNYTSSDDGLCTRTNLFNGWVNALPDDARTNAGGLTGCSPTIFDQNDLGEIETLEITFNYQPGAEGISTNDANSKN